MKLQKLAGATSEIWQVFIQDSSSATGAGLAGLAFGTSGLTAYYHRDTDTTATAITLVTMTVGTFTSSGFKEIDATNLKGWYQFCPPNAALASGAKSCAFHLQGAANMAPLPIEVQLTAVNPDSATGFVSSVPSVAAAVTVTGDLSATMKVSVQTAADAAITANATIGVIDADVIAIKAKTDSLTFTVAGILDVNTAYWRGTAVFSPGTAGRPDINVVAINNLSTGSVSAINANIGTTQPVNFTGTAGAALAKVDVQDFGGAAGTFSGGIPSVNLFQILGTTLTETAGQIAAGFKKFFNIGVPTSTMNEITLVDTLTTYTGNTPQTGDSFPRIGAGGAGLTALGDARIAHLDADVSSRMATFALPANFATLSISAAGKINEVVTVDALTANNDKTGYALTTGEHTNIATDTQTGLTAQGYTTARAGFLDTLNGLVAAIWGSVTRTLTGFAFTVNTNANATETAIKAKTDNLPADPASESLIIAAVGTPMQASAHPTVGGYASGQDPATLVLDVLAANHNIANTIGADINTAAQGGGGGGTTAQAIWSYSDRTLTSPAVSSYVGPVSQGGTVTIRRGYAYKLVYGNQVQFSSAGWPDLSGALRTELVDLRIGSVMMTGVRSISGSDQVLTFEMDDTVTAGFTAGAWTGRQYLIRAVFDSSDDVELAVGPLVIL